ncbi:MAG: cytochrome c biogenesis protein CcsA [Actinobacteria bacterium]|nr:cytochrome c biogenesis protein CcsA [Actinomycetota bacterium]
MTEMQLAELSRVLFFPVTMLLYLVAMGLYLYALAFTKVDRGADEPAIAGTRALRLATVVAGIGLVTHLGHIVTRSLAAGGRVPWGTMFEYSSVSGFLVVLAGLLIFQWRMRRPEVVGFLLLGSLLTMGAALLLYAEPGPLQPILNSHWLKIHVFSIMVAATVFTVGFIFNGLHLIRDTAEQRVAEARTAGLTGSTVGAAYSGGAGVGGAPVVVEEDEGPLGTEADRADAPADLADGGVRGPADGDDDVAYGAALRATISPWRLAIGTFLGAATISWVFIPASETVATGLRSFLAINLALVAAALLGWWFVAKLPSAATLDSLAYRTIAFGFPIWTFAVLTGAIWAEQSWGRYWGWDPKETSAFLTWVAYAGYLHARATRGFRGRGAAWLGIGAFAVLMFTYYAVNLVVTGLHSYGGLPS